MVWFITIKALPQGVVLVPLFVIFRTLQLLHTEKVTVIVFDGMNTSWGVWRMYQSIKDRPRSILEAAEVDGLNLTQLVLRTGHPPHAGRHSIYGHVVRYLRLDRVPVKRLLDLYRMQPLSVAAEQTPRRRGWAELSAVSSLANIVPVIVVAHHEVAGRGTYRRRC